MYHDPKVVTRQNIASGANHDHVLRLRQPKVIASASTLAISAIVLTTDSIETFQYTSRIHQYIQRFQLMFFLYNNQIVFRIRNEVATSAALRIVKRKNLALFLVLVTTVLFHQ
ncbi:hypothetical protein [Paenibacillus baekrokdamisoli]|uniref:hypothetical protein n=1 Tax=Paenibacillus baekrokdamisoli TaxID=1712516 RepID=UPI001C853ADA|nr:hypothetical protein [Paenibacillus baekrokdamisoli]